MLSDILLLVGGIGSASVSLVKQFSVVLSGRFLIAQVFFESKEVIGKNAFIGRQLVYFFQNCFACLYLLGHFRFVFRGGICDFRLHSSEVYIYF